MNAETSKDSKSLNVTRLLYAAILLCYLLMHFDDGVLSVASERIIRDLQISESQLGIVEAAIYVGIIAGSLVAPFLFAKLSSKAILMVGVLGNAAAVGSWALTNNYLLLACARILNGIFQVSFSKHFLFGLFTLFIRIIIAPYMQ